MDLATWPSFLVMKMHVVQSLRSNLLHVFETVKASTLSTPKRWAARRFETVAYTLLLCFYCADVQADDSANLYTISILLSPLEIRADPPSKAAEGGEANETAKLSEAAISKRISRSLLISHHDERSTNAIIGDRPAWLQEQQLADEHDDDHIVDRYIDGIERIVSASRFSCGSAQPSVRTESAADAG
jgi:hypothetical protein